MTTAAEVPSDNPLVVPWKGPWGGVPPFDSVKTGDFAAALQAGMLEQLDAVARITADPVRPSLRTRSPPWKGPAACLPGCIRSTKHSPAA